MLRRACGILVFWGLFRIAVCEDTEAYGLRGSNGGPYPEETKAAWGRLINQKEWEEKYDFVVIVNITRMRGNRKVYTRCTGAVWKDKVLSAAHCSSGAAGWAVHTATHISGVSKVEVHPTWQPWQGRSSCPNMTEDFLVLTLTQPMQNRQAMKLRSSGNRIDSQLMLAGMGVTARGDANPRFPPRPVVTDPMVVASCPCNTWDATCIGSGPSSQQSSCGYDSGGPWLQWANDTAVVAGVNSFGYNGWCGQAKKMTGLWPTAAAKTWLEQIAPGHFMWSA